MVILMRVERILVVKRDEQKVDIEGLEKVLVVLLLEFHFGVDLF